MKPDHEYTPDDFYEKYSEWLMARARDLYICNGDDLIHHFEAGTRFDEFLAHARAVDLPDPERA